MAQPVDGHRRGPSLLAGYLPLLIGAVAIVAMGLVVPTEVPDDGGYRPRRPRSGRPPNGSTTSSGC
jgi:hypothetical protein